MSPIAQLRAEIGDIALRVEIVERHFHRAGQKAMASDLSVALEHIQAVHGCVGRMLAKEMEQSKQPAKEVRP